MKLTLSVTPQAYRAYIQSKLGPQMLEDYDRFNGLCGSRFFYVRARYFTTGNRRRHLRVSSAVGFYCSRHGQTGVWCLILPYGAAPVLLFVLIAAVLAVSLVMEPPVSPSLALTLVVAAVVLLALPFLAPYGSQESENRLRALLRMAL